MFSFDSIDRMGIDSIAPLLFFFFFFLCGILRFQHDTNKWATTIKRFPFVLFATIQFDGVCMWRPLSTGDIYPNERQIFQFISLVHRHTQSHDKFIAQLFILILSFIFCVNIFTNFVSVLFTSFSMHSLNQI